MIELFKDFLKPTITEVVIKSMPRKRTVLRCSITSLGISELLILVIPHEPLSPNDIANRIRREWAILEIRKETATRPIPYGLSFIADEPDDNYSFGVFDCTIEAVT